LLLSLASLTLLSCAGGKKIADAEVPEPRMRRVLWAAMGTVWTFEYTPKAELSLADSAEIEEGVREIVYRYDMTFSDWTEDSELRQLEREGLRNWQRPSPLFLQGLRYSQEFWKETQGAFDITIGAYQWKEKTRPVKLSALEIRGERFRFKTDPKRLTFGGIAKGMAVGAAVTEILAREVRNFRVDAGGGNLALAGFVDGKSEPWPEAKLHGLADGSVWHVSRSRSRRYQETGDDFDLSAKRGESAPATQHIFDPAAPGRRIDRQDVVVCQAGFSIEEQERMGAQADVYSKALLIRPKLRLPKGCAVWK
jgi:thiamine biosynthesis lipoprotein